MSSYKQLLAAILLAGELAAPVSAGAPYCLPGNPCYPPAAGWDSFNRTVGGRLIKVTPYGAPCYAATYNAEQCLELAKNKGSLTFRDAQPAALMYTNWEQTSDLKGCPVPDLPADGSAPPPVNRSCDLGAMSNYVVNATGVDDVVASVKWAAKFNLRLRIKNTGHCYTGRSSGEGSFAIWTGHLNDAVVVKNFVPQSTKQAPHTVISAGPAVNVQGLYEFGSANGLVTIGGFTQTVGATGGYVLGGGTGPLGPHFGLGVDNVVQFQVVLAKGTVVIANAVLNADLFWALRGGGGTFGVVTRVWLKAYPAFKTINAVSGVVQCADSVPYAKLISNVVDVQIPTRAAGQSGIWETNPSLNSFALISIAAFAEGDTIETTDKTFSLWTPLTNVAGCQASLGTKQFNGSASFIETYNSLIPLINAGGIVGVNLADLSRVVSNDLINDPAGREKIKNFITSSPVPFIFQNAVGGATNKVAPGATAVHPVWRDSFAFIDSPIFGPWDGITAAQNATIETVSKSLTETFGSPAYYNEEYPADDDFSGVQWGSNYPRLLSIKKALDPKGVFSCRNCVGSENGF